MELVNLNQAVFDALKFFNKNLSPKLDLSKFGFPLVIGSGNGYNTGLILFSNQAAIFADESSLKKIIKAYLPLIRKKIITQAIIISASGEKDSVWETTLVRKYKLKTTVLTCSPKSSAARMADQVKLYQKIAEPYTYNISTYLGMILSATRENPQTILNFLQKIKLPKNFAKYQSYSFLLPDYFAPIAAMAEVKTREIFGPHLQVRSYSAGQARHAKFIHRWDRELVISLGEKNNYFGEPTHRLDFKLPPNADFGLMLCLIYSLIGKIQEVKPGYFKRNIKKFCADYGAKALGAVKPLEVIVPGTKKEKK